MENHPIPQDITGFQFKLIGNMTVKQFIYVAIAIILGWFIGLVLIPTGIIGWPVAIIISALGMAFAFIPVDGRPMDVMLGNLIRALLSPTQYIYQKEGGNLAEAVKNNQQANNPTTTQNSSPMPTQAPQTVLITPPPSHLNNYQSAPNITQYPSQAPQPNSQEEKIEKIEEKESQLETQEESINAQLGVAENINQPNNDDDLKRLLEETKAQKEQLEKELNDLKSLLKNSENNVTKPAEKAAEPGVQTENQIPAPMNPPDQEANLQPAPSTTQAEPTTKPILPLEPNLIIGVVKDPRGNILQNILVEVVDMEGNPVRAFKTNNLGKFASATSVANGKYKVILEDPKQEHKFDEIQIEATGAPLAPLEITSIDKREELRRELFN